MKRLSEAEDKEQSSFGSKRRRRLSVSEDEAIPSGTKRRRRLSISEDEALASCSKSNDSLPMSKIYNTACRNKPAELFRKDLISAMKLPDSEQLDEKDFWYVTDTWKQEWERGVQVPVNSKNVPLPEVRVLESKSEQSSFKLPKKMLHLYQDESYSPDMHVLSASAQEVEKVCRYDLDDLDASWLKLFNEQRTESLGLPPLSEDTFELIMEDFEIQCFNKFQEALKTEEGLGIEYDDDISCDVCRNPECEEGNEMVFCDICNICVHQACYGITAIPEGSWVCRTCAANVTAECVLCPKKGGAMKSTKKGDMWAHVSCALWVPEVVIVDPEKMEPISKISQIPPSRWALICTFCRERVGACIQCCVKQCKVAYHITCAFENGLEAKAVYNEMKEEDGVKLKSYCQKHSQCHEGGQETEGIVWRMKTQKKEKDKDDNEEVDKPDKVSDLEKHNARLQKIREMEAVFYKYVQPQQTRVLHADYDVLDFVYNYWKLKRTANFNKPLLPTKLDDSALLGKQPEDSLYARMKMFVHIRQDLERVRNLCYMVIRREKNTRTLFKLQKEIFSKQAEALDTYPKELYPKEHEEIIASSHGDSIYDKIYFAANYKPPETVPVNSKEPEPDKKKLASSARLPNPYAKLYFNGVHTRSRGHTESNLENLPGNPDPPKSERKSQIFENVTKKPEICSNTKTYSVTQTPAIVRVQPKIEEEPVKSKQKSEVIAQVEEKETTNSKKRVKEETIKKEPEDAKPCEEVTGKENVPTVCSDVKKKETIVNEQSICDIKNSPSQSDKENVMANPKNRGKRAKSQTDVKSSELSKIVKDNLVMKLEKQSKHDNFKNVAAGEALKSSNVGSSRYEMRSRNNSTSISHDDAVVHIPEELDVIKDKTAAAVLEVNPESSSKLVLHIPDIAVPVSDHEQTEKNVVKPVIEELSIQQKMKFKSHKRRTRRRLFTKLTFDKTLPDSANNALSLDSGDSCAYEELHDERDSPPRELPRNKHTEYTMTVRQNGKMLLSPLKKLTLSVQGSSPPPEVSLSPISPKFNEKRTLRQTSISSPVCDLSYDSSDSQHASSSSSRDVTSSPRLVIKLVKDRECQQWQKHSSQSDMPTTFRVVRNDWELTSDSKDSLPSPEFESVPTFEPESSGHRYLMRSRSKQNS